MTEEDSRCAPGRFFPTPAKELGDEKTREVKTERRLGREVRLAIPSSIESEIWESSPRGGIRTFQAPGLTYNPKARQLGRQVEILGSKEDPKQIAWGFWSGTLLAGLAAYLVFFRGSGGLETLGELLLFSAALVVGLVVFRLGKRSSLREVVVLEIDLDQGNFNWPTDSSTLVSLEAREIAAVTYKMVEFPITTRADATPLITFGVHIETAAGDLHPVIEATPDKEGAHGVAQLLAQMLRLPVTYRGTGVVD